MVKFYLKGDVVRNLFSFLTVLILPLVLSAQEKITGTLYDLKSKQSVKLYTLDLNVIPQAELTLVQTEFKSLDGKTVVAENGVIKDAELLSYEINRPQTEEKGRIAVRDGRIFFEYEGPGGKTKKADEKLKGKVLCAANFTNFVKAHWDDFQKGEKVDVRFAVWDRLETVGFTLKKVGEGEFQGEKTIDLEMKPTSFVIAALVDPVHLWYSVSDKKIRVMKGRVAPKQNVGGKWKDLDAEVVYTYVQTPISK
jgi:hypothetical protein